MLARIALRLATVQALAPAGTPEAGPWPTLAGAEVWEERLDLIAQSEAPEDIAQALAALENKPVVIVYTEDHHTLPYGQSKYPAEENVVTLAIEISLGVQGVVRVKAKNADGAPVEIEVGSIEAPVTDRQHAAILDMLEAQVRYILDRRNAAPSAALYHTVAAETRSIHSDPQRAADRTLRLALRTLKFHVKVAGDRWPAPGEAPGAGLMRLPEPLRGVALALPENSSAGQLCAALADMVPAAAPLDAPLESVDFVLGLGRTPVDRAGADAVAEAAL